MEKKLKSQIIGKVFIFIFFFSIHFSFLVSLLNPQIPIKTDTALILFIIIFIFSSIIFGIPLFFLFKKYHNYSNLILILFCFLVILIYVIEKNLHPLFFHPSLFKLLKKGIWTSTITFIGIIFLRKHKRIIVFLLIVSSIFLYQRRDAIKFRKTISFPIEIDLENKPKFFLIVYETKKSENFFEELKENEKLKSLNEIIEEGSRGFFKLQNYLKGKVLKTTILTGSYPYVHRCFGEHSNVFFQIYEIDLFPFFFPKIFNERNESKVPYIWEILKNFKIPYKLIGLKDNSCFKEENSIFEIYYYEEKSNEDIFLENKIKNIKSSMKEKDYLCIILPQKGFFYIKGENIKQDYVITSMKIVDSIPTIMFLYNIPLSRYFSGRVLSECIKEDFLEKNPIGVVGKY